MKPVIPIVFATNNAYAPYLGVALQSLIVHSSPKNHYQIYIFHANLTDTHQERLLDLAQDHVFIEMVQLEQEMTRKDRYVSKFHFSAEAIFRLLIPDLLPQWDKVLYLDCDIVVLDDVAKLYATDLGDCVLGVAEKGTWKTSESWVKTFSKQLSVEEHDLFNSGVLVINCKQFAQQKIGALCLSLLEEDWTREQQQFAHQDQDALTVACQGKITRFPERWNFLWQWQPKFYRNGQEILWTAEETEAYRALKKNLSIIHYTTAKKPWNSPDIPFAEHFWKYARQTVFYEEILFKQMRAAEFFGHLDHKATLFPWGKVPLGCDLVLYGGGERGQDYAPQLLRTPLCRLVAICDQHPENVPELGLPVISKEKLKTTAFDYIFITIENEKIAQAVKEDLLALGIAEEKIID